MRKLTYEIFDRQGNLVKEVNTYKELEQEKEKGNSFKCKLTELHERLMFEVYKGKEKITETPLFKKMVEYKKQGYTIQATIRVF